MPAAEGQHRLLGAGLVDDVEFLMARARSIGTLQANHQLKPFGLKVRSYSVLALACSGMGPTQRELAEFLKLDPSQIVALVDELQDRDLVLREADARDRRSKIISATDKGQDLYARAAPAIRAAESQSLAALSETEQTQLRELLQRVAFEAQP